MLGGGCGGESPPHAGVRGPPRETVVPIYGVVRGSSSVSTQPPRAPATVVPIYEKKSSISSSRRSSNTSSSSSSSSTSVTNITSASS